jgi:hypothetical protein
LEFTGTPNPKANLLIPLQRDFPEFLTNIARQNLLLIHLIAISFGDEGVLANSTTKNFGA